MNYYIADLHFNHERIIAFDGRPFRDVAEMNQTLIRNWNETVKANDTIYILGDLIWSKEAEWPAILEQLSGKKVLIRGNHDLRKFSPYLQYFFNDIRDYMEITDSGRHVIMSHYPIPFHRADYDEKCYMLYGHVHNTREYHYLELLRKDLRENHSEPYHARGQFINVGCMMPWMGYRPRTLDEIIKTEQLMFEPTESLE